MEIIDEITRNLLRLIETRDLAKWELASTLVTTMNISYKYQLLYMLKSQMPAVCATCNTTYSQDTCDKLDFIVLYDLSNKLTGDSLEKIDWAQAVGEKWFNKYIKDTEVASIKHYPCCSNPKR